jgi:hypothetical protein
MNEQHNQKFGSKTQKLLSALPTGALGIDRMAVGCYKTGAIKGLSSVFLWLTPIPWIWWGMDVGATFLDKKYMFCDGRAMSPEMMKKVGKFFAYVTGIVAAAAAAYQAQKMAKKFGVKMPGMGKMGKMAGKIPGGMGKMMGKIPGMGMFKGGAREEKDTCLFSRYSSFMLLIVIGFSLLHGTIFAPEKLT